MDVRVRTDKSHPDAAELSYPAKPDTRGHARKSWQGYSYSFGKHNTAESFVLFGEWRKHLIETGEALKTADVREKLAETGVFEPVQEKRGVSSRTIYAVCAVACILLCTVTGIVTWKLSTANAPYVDDELGVITEDDRRILRGHRRLLELQASIQANYPAGSREDRIAARKAALVEGARNGKEANREGT